MKLHCFIDSTVTQLLGTSNLLDMQDELVKIEFKPVLPVKDIIPDVTGTRPQFVSIESWTKTSKYRASDLKDELFNLGATVYLIDTETKEILTTFIPKNAA